MSLAFAGLCFTFDRKCINVSLLRLIIYQYQQGVPLSFCCDNQFWFRHFSKGLVNTMNIPCCEDGLGNDSVVSALFPVKEFKSNFPNCFLVIT